MSNAHQQRVLLPTVIQGLEPKKKKENLVNDCS